MNELPGSSRFGPARSGLSGAVVVWILLVAGAALAANLKDVRVGVYADHTRVVLETDGKAAYQLKEGAEVVTLDLQASARPQAVAAKGPHLAWVRVEPAGATARVKLELRGPARVKQMVLTGPHRIVIDVFADATPAKTAAKAPAPSPAPAAPPKPAPAPAIDDETALLAEANAVLGPEKQAAASEEIVAAEGAPGAPESASLEGAPEAAAPPPAVNVTPAAPPAPIRQAKKPARGVLDPIWNPYVLAILAVVMLGLGVILFRRRPAKAAASVVEEEETSTPLFGRASDDAAAPGADEGAAAPQSAGESAAPAFDFEAPAEAESEKPDAVPARGTMVSTIGVVTPTGAFEPPAPRAAGGLSLGELERRIAHLETRLEEVIDAKDRLERQVSAQTEELRVQRAAIARTQRVLRGVVRPEDEPSEPVLKS